MFLYHACGLVGYVKAIYLLFLVSWLAEEGTTGEPVIIMRLDDIADGLIQLNGFRSMVVAEFPASI